MSLWNLASADGTLTLSLTANDDNGAIQAPSTVWFHGNAHNVTGSWIASNAGLAVATAFALSGNTQTSPNPLFLAASGIVIGPGSNPTSISISATQASSGDSDQKQYTAELFPNQPFTMATGGWTVTLDDHSTGVLNLSLAPDGTLNPVATWTHPSGSPAITVRVTWVSNGTADELSWWGASHRYGSGIWNAATSSFSGTYADKKRRNGTWIASQGK